MEDDWLEVLKAVLSLKEDGPFSTGDVSGAASASRYLSFDILQTLEEIGFLTYMPHAYKYRHWRATSSFPSNIKTLTESYEAHKITTRQFKQSIKEKIEERRLKE